MSTEATVDCHGAPRDLGLDQGRALRERIQSEVATLPWRARIEAALGGGLADSLTARVDRDLRRHFPHMAERLDGLSRGAGTRSGELSALLARELYAAASPGPGASRGLLVAWAPEAGVPALVGRTIPESAEAVRHSAPDHDYSSDESIVPWLVPPLGGRNEQGLCVVGASSPVETVAEAGCAAPALLLVQDCLQRFDSTDKAIEWCQGRPAGGNATLLIADASGDVAEIQIESDDRRVQRPSDGLLVLARSPAEGESLRKTVLESSGGPAATLREALGANGEAVVMFEALVPKSN